MRLLFPAVSVIALLLSTAAAVGAFSGPRGDASLGALASPEVYSNMNVHGAFSQGGGVTTASPVSASYTLTSADLVESNVIRFTASSTMPALTVTLPASTTFPILEKPGASRTWIIENPFTAAATTTTVAAGTGIDLQEPDGQNVVIGINNYAWLTCYRELSSDVVCSVDETIPAD